MGIFFIRRMINQQIVDLVETSSMASEQVAPESIADIRLQNQPLIQFSNEMREANLELKRFLRINLYQHYRVHRMTAKANRIIRSLFDAFFTDPHLLNPEHYQHLKDLEHSHGDSGRARAVADYIAGMTDRYAIAEYRRIFDPAELT